MTVYVIGRLLVNSRLSVGFLRSQKSYTRIFNGMGEFETPNPRTVQRLTVFRRERKPRLQTQVGFKPGINELRGRRRLFGKFLHPKAVV